MANPNNPWLSALSDGEGYEETSGVKEFLKEQGDLLSEATSGKVNAVFRKAARIAEGMAVTATILAARAAAAHGQPLEDANTLYRSERYAFEIQSAKYRFILFWMELDPVFPAILEIDEGVFEEVSQEVLRHSEPSGNECAVEVASFEELKSVFSALLRSHKLRYLLRRLSDAVEDEA